MNLLRTLFLTLILLAVIFLPKIIQRIYYENGHYYGS